MCSPAAFGGVRPPLLGAAVYTGGAYTRWKGWAASTLGRLSTWSMRFCPRGLKSCFAWGPASHAGGLLQELLNQ